MECSMTGDFVRNQGYLTLGSRLRRIGERLQADAQVMFVEVGIDLPVALMPTLHSLMNEDMTIGELASSVGIAQPGVTRNVAQLEALGLVKASRDGKDKRVRRVSLTPKGRGVVSLAISDLDQWIIRAVGEICEPLEGRFLDQLAALEDALAALPLHRRGGGRLVKT
jgi:DNA-binding MarR family transcriptional regulator